MPRAILPQRDARPATLRWRWIAATLLVAFALGQGVAIAHAGGAAHDHEGPCAACRLVGEHASAIAPNVLVAYAWSTAPETAPAAPASHVVAEPSRRHAPRGPPRV